MRDQNGFKKKIMSKKITICMAVAATTAMLLSGCANEKKNEANPQDYISEERNAQFTPENTLEENLSPAEGKRVEPLKSTLSTDALHDCLFAASFSNSDIVLDNDGILNISMAVYDYELFDMVDVYLLEEGDTLVINGEDLLVQSIERNQDVIINGGAKEGGVTLMSDNDGVYYEVTADMEKNYYFDGYTMLQAAEEFVFYDYSDPEDTELVYDADELYSAKDTIDFSGSNTNTSVVVESGKILCIIRN